jgi:excinuclease ABC subunit C
MGQHDPAVLKRVTGLTDQPGVYLFRDAGGTLLYVGKARSLRRRVGSYFLKTRLLSPRVAMMVSMVRDVEARPTASEAEALLLEAQLIKDEKPRYNVVFRDDKAYPMLKVTITEPFPRLMVTRRRLNDGARYFGPYPDAGMMREAVQFLRRVFPLRTCNTFPDTPCLEYHLGQCLAPCAKYVDAAGYQRIVDDLIAFLEGKRDTLLRDLSRRMQQAARDKRFEDAARLRDQIQALTSVITAKEKSSTAGPLEQLQAALKLAQSPRRIEAFDISHIFGEASVGSLVVFTDGRPHKAHYRKFRIATVRGIDDYQMMREVIRRRYGGTLSSRLPAPDLVVVDGGKGQLSAACDELAALSLTLPAIGLAKRFEHIFVPGQSQPIVLLPSSPVLHLLQHVRDEAHRFAITYHRALRKGTAFASALDAVRGIGPVRKRELLRKFGSLRAVAHAEPEAVAQTAGLPRQVAEDVIQRLRAAAHLEE